MTMTKHFTFAALSVLLLTLTASAQFDFTPSEPDGSKYIGGPRLGESQIQIWKTGIILEQYPPMDNVQITIPVPMNWKEQKIINVNEEKTDARVASRIRYQQISDGAVEMQIQLGRLLPSKPLEIIVAFEVQKYELLPPDNPDQYVIPKRTLPKEISQYLKECPYIESNDSRFIKKYSEITKEKRTDWGKVEALYAFVQNNVKYNDQAWRNEAKGALSVIKMPEGEWTADCKDMTCLFVALCRAGKIPARIVRVPGHCYAEFYLDLKPEGRTNTRNNPPQGFWFPCQVSGTYSFGGISEGRVILHKGDTFPDPEPRNPKKRTLFLSEHFRGLKDEGTEQPKFRWVEEIIVK
jgi:hypothetical protein